MRREGEADAELWHPVIKAVVSPPAQRLPGLGLVRGGTKGTGRRWHGPDTKTGGGGKIIPTAVCVCVCVEGGGWNWRHDSKNRSFYSQ